MTTNRNMIASFFKRQVKAMLYLMLLIGSILLQSFNEPLLYSDTIKVFKTPESQRDGRRMLPDFINHHLEVLAINRDKELSRLKTPADWKARQEKTQSQLEDIFGKFPEKTALNARITGKVDHEKYTIEKIIYESKPGYFVTANLYVPKNRKFPAPGIFIPCGHEQDAKQTRAWEQFCGTLAVKGYVVLIIDPMGQGERDEYENVLKGVRQHHYIGRPNFLLNQTLSGLRLWDCIKGVDYLESRKEVDANKLGVIGVSGGGQMVLLITAVDKRIKVCVASHPGGSMEATYLTGQNFVNREILSLIAPRPVRIIAGTESGEGPGHQRKINDMLPFYEGLGYKKDLAQLVMVPGKHGLAHSHEAAFEWINKWFDKEEEGDQDETPLGSVERKHLWSTPEGSAFKAGSLYSYEVNAKLLNQIYHPETDNGKLKERIAERIKLTISKNRSVPKSKTIGTDSYGDLLIEKLTYESEAGITIPALLIKPKNVKPGSPVYLYASDKGKPVNIADDLLLFQLARAGFIVLAIDVRGTGEISISSTLPRWGKYITYTSDQWKQDGFAIRSATFSRTMIGMRTLDVLRGVDYIDSRKDLKGRNVVAMGEGLGGLWASLGSVFDKRITGVVTIGTLPSYKPLITNHYYNINPGYFWLPGALLDFDISDLMQLISPKPNIWINPIGSMGEKLGNKEISALIKPCQNLQIINDSKSDQKILSLFTNTFK